VRVLHIAPTYFADHSVVGGAERYTRELARAMSAVAEVVLLSFGERAATVTDGSLRIELLRRPRLHGGGPLATNPVSPRLCAWRSGPTSCIVTRCTLSASLAKPPLTQADAVK
jgi:hypothetical protein